MPVGISNGNIIAVMKTNLLYSHQYLCFMYIISVSVIRQINLAKFADPNNKPCSASSLE